MNEGFFSIKETTSDASPDGKTYSCVSCGLYKSAKTPKMKVTGRFKRGILNIGGAVNKMEDAKGEFWKGKGGRALKYAYEEHGIDLFEDCLNINAVNCYPGENDSNLSYQVACCRRFVIEAIQKYEPKVIVLFGQLALESVIGHRWKDGVDKLTKWRGYCIPDQDFNAWVCPTFHPMQAAEGSVELNTIWDLDIARIVEHINKPLLKRPDPIIDIIDDLSVLSKLPKQVDRIAIDYETTGIKPQAKGHRIICASVAYTPNACYTFLIPKSKKERQPFLDLLTNPKYKKMAHNMKYEDNWTTVRFRTHIQNWFWDSMIAAHQLDNRTGVTGLKFQTYVQLGVVDYNSTVSPFLKSEDGKNGNAINNIHKLFDKPGGIKELLTYCGLDTIYQYRLAEMQMNMILNHENLPYYAERSSSK